MQKTENEYLQREKQSVEKSLLDQRNKEGLKKELEKEIQVMRVS